jgi:alpha-ribazole phosphatase
MARQLLLVRHGEVGAEWRGRYVGRTDPALSPEGVAQVERLAEALRHRDVGRALCSPSRRTRETADIVRRRTDLEFTEEPDLREVDFGTWEGKTFREIEAADPGLVTQWAEWHPEFAFPGGERISDFLSRVQRVADRLTRDEAGTVLVLAHGGVIRAMLCHLLGLDARQYVAFEIAPAAVAAVRLYDGKGVLTELSVR